MAWGGGEPESVGPRVISQGLTDVARDDDEISVKASFLSLYSHLKREERARG